jgi:hypothetical protein
MVTDEQRNWMSNSFFFESQGDLVSQGRDNSPTDRLRRGPDTRRTAGGPGQATDQFATQRIAAAPQLSPPAAQGTPNDASKKRWTIGRDAVAVVLLLIAPLFPWNLYFGIGIPNSSGAVFALLAAATMLSLVGIAITRAIGSRPGATIADRLRLACNAPYALLVVGFVVFDVVQTVRYGGSANVPGGVGPGAWLGISGALMGAQPRSIVTLDDRFRPWLFSARSVGYTSIALAVLSVLFNLFWRTKAVLPGATGSSGTGKQSVAIIGTAMVYGVVALVPVVVAARWILRRHSKSAQLATIALGASTLAAGIVVWLLPVGREIDGFHGIAQNTSTAGVGFEGYLAWVAAAAIFALPILLQVVTNHEIDRGVWRVAARKAVLLIALWCLASVLMRVTDVIVAVLLQLSRSPYDSASMAAFDVVTAALAIWLTVNLANRSVPVAVISALCGVLFVLSASRIVLGIALAPRFEGTAGAGNPVYGNNLAQQITSTFDVVLSGLALCVFAVAVITARSVQRRPQSGGQGDNRATPAPAGWEAQTTRLNAGGEAEPPAPRIHRPAEPSTRRIPTGPGREDATQQLSTSAPRIFRSDDLRQRSPAPPPQQTGRQPPANAPKIHRPPPNPRQPPGSGPTRGGGAHR